MCTQSGLRHSLLPLLLHYSDWDLVPCIWSFWSPEMIVSDNGSCFVSEEFEPFLVANGVKHITSSPYHPATNSLTERGVQIIKKGLKKVTTGTLQTRPAQILMSYRITPQSTTGASPAELLLGRQPRTRLDLFKTKYGVQSRNKQLKQKVGHDRKAKTDFFSKGEKVYARNFGIGNTWIPGEITELSDWECSRYSACNCHWI